MIGCCASSALAFDEKLEIQSRILSVRLFEAECPSDDRPRAAIARTRAFSRGELDTAPEIRKRFGGGSAARETKSPAAAAAARAAGQASAIWVRMRSGRRHMPSRQQSGGSI